MMFQIGARVRVKPPFNEAYPDVYEITGISETGAWIVNGFGDFAEEYLELVE